MTCGAQRTSKTTKRLSKVSRPVSCLCPTPFDPSLSVAIYHLSLDSHLRTARWPRRARVLSTPHARHATNAASSRVACASAPATPQDADVQEPSAARRMSRGVLLRTYAGRPQGPARSAEDDTLHCMDSRRMCCRPLSLRTWGRGTAALYKTRLCQWHASGGKCTRGASCRHAHGWNELRPAEPVKPRTGKLVYAA